MSKILFFLALSLLSPAAFAGFDCPQQMNSLLKTLRLGAQLAKEHSAQIENKKPFSGWIDLDIEFANNKGYMPQLLGRKVVMQYFSPEGQSKLVHGVVQSVPYKVKNYKDIPHSSSVGLDGLVGSYLIEDIKTGELTQVAPQLEGPMPLSDEALFFKVKAKPLNGKPVHRLGMGFVFNYKFSEWERIYEIEGMIEHNENTSLKDFINKKVAFLVKNRHDSLAEPEILMGHLVEIPREVVAEPRHRKTPDNPDHYLGFQGFFGIQDARGKIERVSYPFQILDARFRP